MAKYLSKKDIYKSMGLEYPKSLVDILEEFVANDNYSIEEKVEYLQNIDSMVKDAIVILSGKGIMSPSHLIKVMQEKMSDKDN